MPSQAAKYENLVFLNSVSNRMWCNGQAQFSNKDIFERLLLSSEPLITSIRKKVRNKQSFAEDISPFVILPKTDVPEIDCDSSEYESE